jgi:hypothetical protein
MERFMACQKRHFYWLLLSCAVLTVFSGCASKTPITKTIIEDIAMPDVNKKPEDLQYFISKKIILTLNQTKLPLKVEKGILKEETNKIRKRITIPRNLQGTVQSTEKNGDGYLLEVGFENNHRDCLIRFSQNPTGDDEKYYLRFDDEEKFTIKYGDSEYTVHFEDNRLPFLLIEMNQKCTKKSERRTARGWRLGK